MNDIIVADKETGELKVADQAISIIRQNEQMRKQVKDQDAKIKASLLAAMEEYGIKKITTDDMTVSYVDEHEQIRLNTKKLKEDFPNIVDQYEDFKPVKASVRVRLK